MGRFPWPNWWNNRDEDIKRQDPIVWVDEPINCRPDPPPAPPPVKPTTFTYEDMDKARDLLIAVKILSKDTMDFLLYNDCGHSQEGLWERHQTLVEFIEKVLK